MNELEELKKKIDDALLRQKGYEMDLVIIEIMLKKKKDVLTEADEKIKEINSKLDSLVKDFNEKNKELFVDLLNREEHIKTMGNDIKKRYEILREEENKNSILKDFMNGELAKMDALEKDYKNKTNKMKELTQAMLGVIG